LHGHGRCEDDVVREVVQHLIEIVGEVAMAVGIAVLGPRPMTQPLASGLAGLGGEGVQDDPALEGADDGCVGSARVVARGAAFHGAGAGLAFPSPDEPVGEVGEQVVTAVDTGRLA